MAFAVEQRAVVTNRQHLYRKADLESKTMGRLTVGDEVTVRASKGVLLQVAAPGRQPGWTLANGLVVLDNNPKAPGLLFQAAEVLAEGDSPKDWIRASRLFRNAASLVLDGPYAPEARWRAAELSWRIVVRTAGVIAPSSGAVAELEGVVRSYPKTRAAAEAAFLLLRTNLCDYWDGNAGLSRSRDRIACSIPGRISRLRTHQRTTLRAGLPACGAGGNLLAARQISLQRGKGGGA